MLLQLLSYTTMPGVAPATHTIRHSQRQRGDTTPNQSVSVPEVHVSRYPTTEERSDGRGYQSTP